VVGGVCLISVIWGISNVVIEIIKMNMTEYLSKTLEKYNVDYKVERNGKNGDMKISVFFQASFKTLCVIFQENQEMNDTELIIDFIVQPHEMGSIKIKSLEWENFIEQMILPGYKQVGLNESVFDSWVNERTADLLIVDYENETSKMYFIGLDHADNWSFLQQQFVMNSFIRPVCTNEAGKEGGQWSAAQYKTAYSNSFINYEGITHDSEQNQMVFFLSCSYVPSGFGVQKFKAKSDLNFKLTHDENMPVDLVLAIETLDLPLMDHDAILREITKNTPNAHFFTYLMLSYYGYTELLKYIPEIVRAKNQTVIDYLRSEYAQITNEKVKQQFLLLID
jgi:hypothetical protein